MARGGPAAERRRTDSLAGRLRMETAEAERICTERAATSRRVTALARSRGLRRFLVRGPWRMRAALLWVALAHNLLRAATLRHAAALTA